jgi:DNA-binding NtrC family response regulator
MVRAGQFREDLYYRLAVVATHVPPLRERKADIPALAAWFADRMGRGSFAQSPALLEQLERHSWPGNVRELRNVGERALSLGATALSDLGEPPPRSAPAGEPDASAASAASDEPGRRGGVSNNDVLDLPFKEAKAALVESFERDYLTALLARHRGNISRAASEAGIDRNYIHRLVKKYGLEVDRG